MPNRDGTGPLGDGRLGRRMGNCFFSRSTNLNAPDTGNYYSRGFTNIVISLFVNIVRHLLNRKSITRR
ncbi:MAG: DUF5320 domain-containing protein [Candidatus Cloacimonetes bacterium]|nr:DUF5320 domain-containing protein [Candidatus Cloacimonadota bacterium]MDD4560708.1 DUF5320 domain-containing protein [Candidatus Cloacimonadota bacterium]